MRFSNRQTAGKLLAQALFHYRGKEAIIYALPRGGVVLGTEIARELNLPLDLVITRKIGHPNQPEYAIAAIAEDGHMLGNSQELEWIDPGWLKQEKMRQRKEAKKRRMLYLKGRKKISAKGKIAILIDDGVATGLTIRLGIRELRHESPKKIVVAVPVVSLSTAKILRTEADELVALDIPNDSDFLGAVGAYYDDFPQVTHEEVVAYFNKLL